MSHKYHHMLARLGPCPLRSSCRNRNAALHGDRQVSRCQCHLSSHADLLCPSRHHSRLRRLRRWRRAGRHRIGAGVRTQRHVGPDAGVRTRAAGSVRGDADRGTCRRRDTPCGRRHRDVPRPGRNLALVGRTVRSARRCRFRAASAMCRTRHGRSPITRFRSWYDAAAAFFGIGPARFTAAPPRRFLSATFDAISSNAGRPKSTPGADIGHSLRNPGASPS